MARKMGNATCKDMLHGYDTSLDAIPVHEAAVEEALYNVLPTNMGFRLAVDTTADGKRVQDWYVYMAGDGSVGMRIHVAGSVAETRHHYNNACSMTTDELAHMIVDFARRATVCKSCGVLVLDHAATADVPFS